MGEEATEPVTQSLNRMKSEKVRGAGSLSREKCGRDTKGGERNLMQINLYVKVKLAGTDEGKILDDLHSICYVREGKPCAGKGMYLTVAQPR